MSNLSYNGLGQRLSMDAAGVIATYVLDGDRPLTAESNGNTTFYLYGLGAIGEKTTDWAYSLPDGTNTPRQLTNLNGEVTLAGRYTSWGDTLDSFGTGNFTFGYLGGVLDATTGLIYVGNGQYYDPATGRFLTRDVYPNSPNPYVPWNPIGAILAPLAVLSMFYGCKKKRSKWDTFVILVLLGISAGIGIVACAPAPTATAPAPNPVPTSTPNNSAPAVPPGSSTPWGPATITATLPIATDSPIPTVVAISCEAAPLTPTPTPSLEQTFRITFKESGVAWTAQDKDSALKAVVKVAEKFALILGGTAADAWARTYEYMEFQMGGCTLCAPGGESAGYTTDRHNIAFAGISNRGEYGRNLVVHELGHAFKALLHNKTGIDVYAELTAWRSSHPSFPDRLKFSGDKYTTGPHYGFYSLQNQILWQVSLEGGEGAIGDDEEFADQFLGWTFNMWEVFENTDILTDDGQARADMMNSNMPYWVTLAGK